MNQILANKRELQKEQAAAVYEIKKHVSVTAGPGSGKTTVLVERYLHILRENKNLNIDQIVAITFTNRAANEMRERVRKDLDRILASCSGDERQRWMRFKRTLDGAVITTIHGFCALLLREFPVEARIDPQFLLLDAHDAAILLESAVEETLTEFISSGRRSISELALGFGRSRLAEALVQLYWNVRGQGLALDELQKRTQRSHSTPDDYARALADLTRVMEEFFNFGRLTPAAEAKRTQARREWPTIKALIEDNPASLANYCNSIEEFRLNTRLTKNTAVANLVEKLDAHLWGAEKKGPLGLVPQICFDLRAQDYALEVIEVLKEVERRYREKKQNLAALDFEDLQLRALELLEQPAVLARATERYRFFLVDEFQDTNSVQRELMHKLTFSSAERVNLFMVGDRKQSIYGFRGADVDVFQQTTRALKAAGGVDLPLHLNFRSQPRLINFFNYLFERLFQPDEVVTAGELPELGFVGFEKSEAKRAQEDATPVVELLIDTEVPADDEPRAQKQQAERDAKQVAQRILALTKNGDVQFRHVALLFRAMTDVPAYEATFRAANIPFQTVQGKGFYQREEISDLIQLLRFLDNKTDELALAAVLRSPLGGISDNALLALRCAPLLNDLEEKDELFHFTHPRKLLYAMRRHTEIAYIGDDDRAQLDRADKLLRKLLERRNQYPIAELLRIAVEEAEYLSVIAANFDGAQKLANVRKLFTLAERFEHAGAHLVRDFVRYVEDFEAIGSREGEGQIDDSANAVRLMTIHQAKGLEFPVVIIPNLHHRTVKPQEHWYALDRHRGLTVKIPDGRGKQVAGCTLERFRARNQLREHFESVRLLYVAATRAKNRLILAGVTESLDKLKNSPDNWLKLIWQKLELQVSRSGVVDLEPATQLQVTLNSVSESSIDLAPRFSASASSGAHSEKEAFASLTNAFPLLQPIAPVLDPQVAGQRLSVTQLINYERCPRQYYFDRVLRIPSADELAIWNNAEAPEPPANLNATLKGAVIHRFCETYTPGDDVEKRLAESFSAVIRTRQAQLADRLEDINVSEALKELSPLAQNYLASAVFQRAERARRIVGEELTRLPAGEAGLWSELTFRLRRPWGILTGTIDKLLITPSPNGAGFEVEIIDFKTNRITAPAAQASSVRVQAASVAAPPLVAPKQRGKRLRESESAVQFAFEFSSAEPAPQVVPKSEVASSIAEQVSLAASDYQLQMQAYALAVHELLPALSSASIRVTLHFLHPNVEWMLSAELLAPEACVNAIDGAMKKILRSVSPEDYPVRPAHHCGMCAFLRICGAGREHLSNVQSPRSRPEGSS